MVCVEMWQVKRMLKILLDSLAFQIKSINEILRGKITITTDTYVFRKFQFNKLAYPNTENPNLDGKDVKVYKIRVIDHTDNDAETVKYAFFDYGSIFKRGKVPDYQIKGVNP